MPPPSAPCSAARRLGGGSACARGGRRVHAMLLPPLMRRASAAAAGGALGGSVHICNPFLQTVHNCNPKVHTCNHLIFTFVTFIALVAPRPTPVKYYGGRIGNASPLRLQPRARVRGRIGIPSALIATRSHPPPWGAGVPPSPRGSPPLPLRALRARLRGASPPAPPCVRCRVRARPCGAPSVGGRRRLAALAAAARPPRHCPAGGSVGGSLRSPPTDPIRVSRYNSALILLHFCTCSNIFVYLQKNTFVNILV